MVPSEARPVFFFFFIAMHDLILRVASEGASRQAGRQTDRQKGCPCLDPRLEVKWSVDDEPLDGRRLRLRMRCVPPSLPFKVLLVPACL
ncbi:hypothetical protein BS50DRAFT_274172 [Corynespora cassiicola Philippines]|uniref:Secreted protein n=1 Tax=Corynespora cassiicola Philippines TaxID=1448308 RepID=A0A2T2P0A6_CORCC|nr:hypothetical protein BS50DRAFT_274172 [Corynespora cassiicola Philippines]